MNREHLFSTYRFALSIKIDTGRIYQYYLWLSSKTLSFELSVGPLFIAGGRWWTRL